MLKKIRKFIGNVCRMFLYNYRNTDMDLYAKFSCINQKIDSLQLQIILSYFQEHSELSSIYASEIEYLSQNGLCVFPYRKLMSCNRVERGYDADFQLPYVVHNNRKLYFPSTYSVEYCVEKYTRLIENENIVGVGGEGGYREKSPHCYQTKDFKIEDGDVLFDVGCAEALLSLDVIEKIKKVYLIEGDPLWIPALNATFAPYSEKCVIINKYVSDEETETSLNLSSILKDEEGQNVFIKMDIEGCEYQVLQSCKDVLARNGNMRVSCCTYHRRDDARLIEDFFNSIGRKTEFSEGYMIFSYDIANMTPPYFRKGVLYSMALK